MRVLVCGGRDYADRERVRTELDALKPTVLIEGGARGADLLAAEWRWGGHILTCQHLKFPADWNKHGKSAGAIRNRQMLDEGKPDIVLAFPGGPGTADMIRQAKKAGVEVREIK